MCFSVSTQSLDKFDLLVFCRTCSWIQSVLRSHRTSNTLKHLDSPLQGETFLIDRRINVSRSSLTQSTIESCSLLLKHIVRSGLPTMLSEVLGESLPYLGKLTKTWIACHSHTGGIPRTCQKGWRNRHYGTGYVPLELCFADIIIQLANLTEEAISSGLGFLLILLYPGLATPVSWRLHAWCYGV